MQTIHDNTIKNIQDCFTTTNKGTVCWFHDKFGSFLINTLGIYSKSENLYIYKNGVYRRNDNDILRAIQLYCKDAKESFRKEVSKYIQVSAPVLEIKDDVNLIGCQNGVYNIETDEFTGYDKDMFLQHKLSADYNKDAKSDAVDKMLNKITCNNKAVRSLIEEMIGYCLYRNCRYQKVFLLRGFGKNGKSTLLESIQNMIGEENYSALSLNNLQDKFKVAELQDKLANICDDLSNAYIKETEDFKKIATGGEMTMERKNQQPFKYKNYAKLIMCANEIPKSADKTEGYYRRFVIIPLDAKISNTDADFDPNISDKLATEEAKSYLLNLALNGLKRLLKRGYFEEIDETKEEMNTYKAENDPIIAFVNEYELKNINNKTTDSVFSDFCDWYKKENNKASTYTKTSFSRTLNRVFNVTSEPRNIGRVYIVKNVNPNELQPLELSEEEKLPFDEIFDK